MWGPIIVEEVTALVDPTQPLVFIWEVVGPDKSVGFRYLGLAPRGATPLRARERRKITRQLRNPGGKGYDRILAEATRHRWTLRLTLLANFDPTTEPLTLAQWRRFYGVQL